MATQTYTVKSGDTLGKIASNYGVSTKDITGYSSGNPDLIRPGETLTIGPTKATQYASGVKDALTGDSGSGSTTGTTGSKSSTSGTTDDYLSTLRDSISSAQKTVSDAATQLSGLKTKAYNDAYSASGLDTTKSKIADLDSTIAEKKAARDAAIAKVQQNPGLSAASMTGTAKKLADQANAEINDLIGERNSLAGDYNTGLTEISTKVANEVGDAQTAYDTAAKALDSLTSQAKDYQSALLDALKQGDTKAYQDESLAIALQNANSNALRASNSGSTDTSWKLAINPLTGQPSYWYNSSGETRPLSAADRAAAAPAGSPAPAAGSDSSVETPAASSGNWFSNLLSSLNPFK